MFFPNGKKYLVCADIELSYIRERIVHQIFSSAVLALIIGALVFPMILFYVFTLKHEQAELNTARYRDNLTLLPNRDKLLDDIERVAGDKTLILINVDSFQEVNDFYGTKAGDFFLLTLAIRLKRCVYEYESGYILYKMAGDEYAVLVRSRLEGKQLEMLLTHLFTTVAAKTLYLWRRRSLAFGYHRGGCFRRAAAFKGRSSYLRRYGAVACKKSVRTFCSLH